MIPTTMSYRDQPLHILQYNTHRSKDKVMAAFLKEPETLEADIIAIQEPWENEYADTTHHPANRTHQLLYPKKDSTGARARVCLYVNRGTHPKSWQHRVISRDYHLVRLQYWRGGIGGEARAITIHNIYNEPGGKEALPLLHRTLRELREDQEDHIVLGDMNLHHPLWGGAHVAAEAAADQLISIMDDFNLELLTPQGLVTWQRAKSETTIDLTFASRSLCERTVETERGKPILITRADNIENSSDHYPIRTLIDIQTAANKPPKRRNFKKTDPQKLQSFVQENLGPIRKLQGAAHIEYATDHLVEVIQRAIQISTPWATPSQYANPDFTPECKDIVKLTRRLRRLYTLTHNNEDWQQYTATRNLKKRLVAKTLRNGHRRRVKDVTEEGPKGLWRMWKWASTTQAYDQGCIPTLRHDNHEVTTPEGKGEIFRKVFFPRPPPADLEDLRGAYYPDQLEFPKIEEWEIEQAIRDAPAGKAPGDDAIPNGVLHLLVPSLLPYLTPLFNACIKLGYNPSHFQTSVTVVLRKGGRRSYREPKSYRPVALLNTLGKVLEAVMARRISYMLEEHGLLPPTHFGGRKGLSTDHALHHLVDRVRRDWGRGFPVVSMLLVDVSGAFDNVNHERVIHNARKLGLGRLTPWIQSYLTARHTRIRMPEHTTPLFNTETGIPQGSPLSLILYLIYNSPLIHEGTSPWRAAYGWVDDVGLLATGRSVGQALRRLEYQYSIASQWARRHASVFAPDKCKLIHFINPRRAAHIVRKDKPLIIERTTILHPQDAVKYLGVWLDKELTFEEHRKQAIAKVNGTLDALKRIAGSTWGTSLEGLRRVYQATVIPQLLFASSVWYNYKDPALRGKASIVRQLTKVQKRAAIIISGAFRNTAAEALDIELFLLPMQQQLERRTDEAAIRIITGPEVGRPAQWHRPRRPEAVRLGGLTPIEIFVRALPTGPAGSKWESREAFMHPPWWKPPETVIEDREKALASHATIKEMPKMLSLYTDGSGYEGHIGASLHVPQMGGLTQKRHLGPEEVATVYTGELSGLDMATQLLEQLCRRGGIQRFDKAVIFTDSQAAIKALRRADRRASGQQILARVLNTLHYSDLPTTIQWIPAHVGVAGNEAADKAAKEAAKDYTVSNSATVGTVGTALASNSAATDTPDPDPNPPPSILIRFAAAARTVVRREAQVRWERQWAQSRVAAPTKRLIAAPNKRSLRIYQGLQKAFSSILIQLRTGRISLNHFLFKIGVVESAECGCEQGLQTPKHILFSCPLLYDLRQEMWRHLDRLGIKIRTDDYGTLVSEPRAVQHVANFMLKTGLLGQFQAVEPIQEEPANGDSNADTG